MSEGSCFHKKCVSIHLTRCIYFTFQVLLSAENKAEINALATAVDKSGIYDVL